MVDIMRLPNESLLDYHVRGQKDVKENWTKLSPATLDSFSDHMLKVIC
jgi:hypothetical protein